MLKFQRNYYAEITIFEKNVEKEVVTISYPTTLQMQIDIGIIGTSNTGVFQFINLSPEIQAKLWLDMYSPRGEKEITVKLYAGYGNTMPLIFYGIAILCTSYRQTGSVDWVTQLQAFEGSSFEKYGFINATFSEGTKVEDVVNYMLQEHKDVSLGAISPDITPLQRDKTFIGQSMKLLQQEYGGYNIFIDKGKLNILGNNEVVKGDLLVISDKTGLLGSPRRANLFTEIDTIFEPRLRIGQAISLLSQSAEKFQNFNQAYEVINVKHYGTISDRTCGTLTTTATLAAITTEPKTVEDAKPTTYEAKNTDSWDKPVKNGRITSPFGLREKPLKDASTNHQGIDIGANAGTPVYAPANGKVIFSGWFNGYGRCIQIDHGDINGKHVVSLYGHLNTRNVTPGILVYKGETVIGTVGSTGVSSGPHLHFQITENGVPVNPIIYIGNY